MKVIGVDVGGTKVSVATLEGTTLSEPRLRPTETESPEALVDQLTAAIEELGPADAVGIGIPSVVDFETGSARSSVNIPLQGVPLRQLLTDRLGCHVFVDNDATVAALAEAYDDDLEPIARCLVMLTVGTGVGGGIVINGQVYRGATGAAAELGHQIVGADLVDGAPPHSEHPPQPGSLERLAAGRALDELGRERGFKDGRDVVDAGKAGDEKALEALRILGERLRIGIANAINTFDPEEVVIGGDAARAGELLLAPARRVALGYVLPGLGARTTIRLARHGRRVGVLGAALLARCELEAGT